MKEVRGLAICSALALLSACASTGVNNSAGRATVYEDVRTSSPIVQGVGIESQDIVAVTDRMMRDMLSNQLLAGRTSAPRVIIDSQYFTNESSSRINKNMITDRLRIELQRAAQGRMLFIGREYSGMVEAERALKRDGVTDAGTIRSTRGTAGADYRLVGRITSADAVDSSTALTSRYQQISFEMIDLEYGTVVWSGLYEFKKTAQDDIIYR
ncbi:penicillin-binding protein activator LpoB [Halopseudomonas xiamenensis]|uniref:penicillin-binding protein activator LpoB n=1 Tax=Halopseudomonas xiamenensis TaxID=157792 RepID=UPI0016238940|nr:penicillin-binding protein activator LpoB [Halopseudomonas xiamenensis]